MTIIIIRVYPSYLNNDAYRYYY